MIPKTMSDLINFEHELRDPEGSWKEPNGFVIFRMVNGARVHLTKDEGIEIMLALERELWKARETGVWNENEDYDKFIEWMDVLTAGVGACPVCNCGEVNAEIEKRRANDPEILAHFDKIGVDLKKIYEEHKETRTGCTDD